MSNEAHEIVVVKIGGSVFSDAKTYRRTAQFLRIWQAAAPSERYVVVVSAQKGLTDDLERAAVRIVPQPNGRALDLLWATGELRSVALITLQLQAIGVCAAGLNVHETGLTLAYQSEYPPTVDVQIRWVRRAIAAHTFVVVPGFLATNHAGEIVSLGRGGSDLTAVLLARELAASRCELIKDVAGYFTSDPNVDRDAQPMPRLSYEEALRQADEGCPLVQRQAIEAAQAANIRLVVRGLRQDGPASIIASVWDSPKTDTLDEPGNPGP